MSMYSTQYLLGSFCLNYCSNAAWHGVDQSVDCSGVMRAQVALIVLFCIVGSGISHLPLHKVKVRRVCWPIKNRDTMVLKPGLVALALCAGAKFCWKMKSASHKVGQQQEA